GVLLSTFHPDRIIHMPLIKFLAVGISLRSTAYSTLQPPPYIPFKPVPTRNIHPSKKNITS
ncbi:MAG: hypothetical protein ACFCU6_13525, partial [Balneolaceae bacterium]